MEGVYKIFPESPITKLDTSNILDMLYKLKDHYTFIKAIHLHLFLNKKCKGKDEVLVMRIFYFATRAILHKFTLQKRRNMQ